MIISKKTHNQTPNFIDGAVILIHKELNWTSFDVVRKIHVLLRKKLNVKKIKVGHAGTLDPLAMGLLIVCTGKATKTINEYQGLPKEYIAEIKLGATTPSSDLETEIDYEYKTDHISEEMIADSIESFIGESDQIPPLFSAKKINGKRAYDLARAGKTQEMKPSRITIHEAELISASIPTITARFLCSKGTYIRSIARDLGERLESGSHLTGLVRTKIGEFSLNDALSIDEFEKILRNS